MELKDVFRLILGTIRSHRMRTFLTVLGIAIGTSSVILLTSIGEGLRFFMLDQFTQFGTNLMSVNPGAVQTFGMPTVANTVRKLTIEDAEELRRVTGVEKVVPVAFGSASVETSNRSRSVFIYGVTSDALETWKFAVGQGMFIPPSDPRRGAPVVVLGPKLKREIFGEENALGKYVHVGGRRFQVIGVMAVKGQMLGFDLDDAAYIPTAVALKLFNKDGLLEVDILFNKGQSADVIEKRVTEVMKQRHGGEVDFTIITQTEMLKSLDKILGMITLAVGAIAAISLVVGAVGILTMMWISVNERIAEIGLEKAIGAEPHQILMLFLSEAAGLSVLGGIAGVAVGIVVAQTLGALIPALPVRVPVDYVILSLAVSVVVGLLSGILPARRAAGMDPVEALRAE